MAHKSGALEIDLSTDIDIPTGPYYSPIMDEVMKAELELIRLKVRLSMEAADRGEIFVVDDAFLADLFRRADARAAQRSHDINA